MKTSHLYLCELVLLAILLLSSKSTQAGSATWQTNPVSGDWNTAANWTPNTVPNGPNDIATFALSDTTSVSLSADTTTAKEISFVGDASAFTISLSAGRTMTFTGVGVVNQSGLLQNFVASVDESDIGGTINFTGNASAGSLTQYTAEGVSEYGHGPGTIFFFDDSDAGEAVIDCQPGTGFTANSGAIVFSDSSSAADAFITLGGGIVSNGPGGAVAFADSASAGNATIVLNGGTASNAPGAMVHFMGSATADQATVTLNGGQASGAGGAFIDFRFTTTAGEGIFVVNGGTVSGAEGAELDIFSSAGNATITTNGGTGGGDGGRCVIASGGDGGTARFKILDNSELSISSKGTPVTLGSLEGDGALVVTGTLAIIGSNNLDTTFSGLISGGGSMTKVGSGVLTLSGANTYTDRTTVSEGTLIVANATGSATGTNQVNVNAGTLGGRGIIAGKVIVGTGSGAGAFLAPAVTTNKQFTLTIQSALTFKSDATYTCTFKARRDQARNDKAVANGVTINSGASLNSSGRAQTGLQEGLTLTVIDNTAATPIAGTFSNLPEGAIVNVNGNNFQASYSGGDGNDLTLAVVP